MKMEVAYSSQTRTCPPNYTHQNEEDGNSKRNSYHIWGSQGSEDSYCDLQGYDYFFNIIEN